MNRRTFLRMLVAPIVLAAGALGWGRWNASRNSYYDGPLSDHFDGVRFFNPGYDTDKSRADLLRFLAVEKRAEWPESWPSPFQDKPPAKSDALRVTLIGHASYLIQVAGLNVLTDPVYSERASPFTFAGPKRVNAPGIAFEDLPKIDIVLVTHNHYDHLDLKTLARLAARDNPRVVTPLGNDAIMKVHDPSIRTETYDWGERADLGSGIFAVPVPTAHWSARGLSDRRKALWASFVIETPAGRLYHVGDSAYAEGRNFKAHREAYGPFRLALLPIGAYEPRWFMQTNHMNPQEAVWAMKDLGVPQALGHHWGTFQLTAEPIEEPAQGLGIALAGAGIAPGAFLALRPGQVFEA
ncbi:membrane protein [Terrihabitans soli]|uniref:Membrane protein n=1 Tax=Terrihabitans soli TaxID=708113 RepID=A0A6S6QR03_9HYPH|nr:MBL fold metallo-hydrolase [Terrihabitans soli]BCJ89471.1 membrane protein [Terrihabitans soli]